MHALDDLPPAAAFTHAGVRDGFETVCFRAAGGAGGAPDGFLFEGGAAAVEDGVPWTVQYRVAVDQAWRTTRVEATGVSPTGHRRLSAEVRGGRWWVDGVERPDLDGCVDVDLEASLVTNTLPVHRLDLHSPDLVDAPAAFIRAADLGVERIEQGYRCTGRDAGRIVVDYASPTFDVACTLVLDGSGLVVDYPGLGRRHS